MATIASQSTTITADTAASTRGLKLAHVQAAGAGLNLDSASSAASVVKQLGPGAASARLASQAMMARMLGR